MLGDRRAPPGEAGDETGRPPRRGLASRT
jgi:hypothetical protein